MGTPEVTTLRDRLGRPVEDLRVSVTDRCNLRCRYCMPREVFGPDHTFLPRSELLSFEEITRIVRTAAGLGVTKVRLTGGEPLLRKDLPELIAQLVAIDGLTDLALTTNGLLLPQQAAALADAGLHRITVSLDALDEATFREVADTKASILGVLEGIEAARAAGLGPIKVNTVLRRGMNDDQLEDLAGWAREADVTLRFIEFMDVGTTNGWLRDGVVPAAEVVDRIHARWPIEPVDRDHPGEVAERYRYTDGAGEVGVVASVTRAFCRDCTRARLSAIGELYTCLFAATGHDLRAVLRDEAADDTRLRDRFAAIWSARTDRASELRAEEGLTGPRVEMSYIGG
ncbi:GTP 3',8-cyclase MoaA [Nitriliruptor alkaliphilus]|uniref:GTP 3',8-cyclase MoaA n=1 Tax=Nitriliruptor alkaliphilus TaxID=427918 RepID=UPI0006983A25|nr:GTP 3',8-cyclase MoaA [Nitriliruptor alkaliphilus]